MAELLTLSQAKSKIHGLTDVPFGKAIEIQVKTEARTFKNLGYIVNTNVSPSSPIGRSTSTVTPYRITKFVSGDSSYYEFKSGTGMKYEFRWNKAGNGQYGNQSKAWAAVLNTVDRFVWEG